MIARHAALFVFVLAGSACAAAGGEGAEASSALGAEPEPELDFGSKERISLTQNSTWTIDQGVDDTYRVVAYGDSIFAGYQRSLTKVARRAAPLVAAEYLSLAWNTNVEVVRRTVSGAVASEVFATMRSEKSFMAAPSTRAVYFEMCGNDYLKARRVLERDGGQCNFRELDDALATCVRNMESAMRLVNETAVSAKAKVVANLYYPGFDGDDVQGRCTSPTTGARINIQDTLLPYMARSNWQACTLAKRYGFGCADSFAEYMAADYDTNGDGIVDSDAIRFSASESEGEYVEKITKRLRSTLVDSNRKRLSPTVSADYLFTDDIHPTYFGDTIGTGTGEGGPDFAVAQLASGKNPKWNQYGHERMGWALARFGPQTP